MTTPTTSVTLAEVWGGEVAKARRAAGLSQAALAEKSGVRQQTISAIENGKTTPTDPLKLAMAQALDVAPGDLFVWPEVP